MTVRNTTLAPGLQSPLRQYLMQMISPGMFDDPESVLVAEDHDDFDCQLADLAVFVRDWMNLRGIVAPSYLLEPEYIELRGRWMVLTRCLVIVPPMLMEFNGNEPFIEPASISDPLSSYAINNRQNLLHYIRSNFTPDDKGKLLEAILDWFQANFSDQETSSSKELCSLLRDFNTAIRRAIQDQL